jgi:hypothetical protein
MKLICTIDETQLVQENILENLTLKSNSTNNILLIFIDRNGYRLDITDWMISFIVREEFSGMDNIIEKEVTTHSDPTMGESTITLTSDEIEDIIGNYLYSINIITNDLNEYTVREGSVCFQAKLE